MAAESGRCDMLCSGEITIDEICEADSLDSPNASVKLRSMKRYEGGRGANVAVFAKASGANISLIGALGSDQEGKAYKARLESIGIDLSGAFIASRARTSRCFIFNHGGASRIFFYGGAMLEEPSEYTSHIRNEIARRKHSAIFATSPSQEINIISLEEGKGLKFYAPSSNLHSHSKESIEECMRLADVVFLNDDESEYVEAIFGSKLSKLAEDFGVTTLVSTHGARGSTIIMGNERIEVPAFTPRRILDTTGAGDAYAGVFAARYLRNRDATAAAKAASACASFVVEELGAQGNIPSWEQVEARMHEREE